ncbi:MAG: hypothetical protein AAAFM81_02625 [Pseudomonadota bacterium]
MHPITRFFESEEAANATINALVSDQDYAQPRERSLVISPSDPSAAAKVDAAVESGMIDAVHSAAVKSALARGRTVMTSRPVSLNTGRFVEKTLNAHCVDRDAIYDYMPSNAAPLSTALGIPVLSHKKSETVLIKFDKDSSFGLKLLARRNFILGTPKLRQHKSAKGTSIARMSRTAAPVTGKIIPLLTKRKAPKQSAVNRMSKSSAPFSSIFGLRVLSKRD